MGLFELLDRIGERRAQRMHRPRDIRQFIGFMFLAGYYVLVYQFTLGALPDKNVDLIRDAMLTLGPPIGIIIGAMFRSDARDERATENTGQALRTIREAVAANAPPSKTTTTTTTGEPTADVPAGTEADPLIVAGAPEGSPAVRTKPEKKP